MSTHLAAVTVPQGVQPGQNFTIQFEGQYFQVACPSSARPGQQIQVAVPVPTTVPVVVPTATPCQPPAPQLARSSTQLEAQGLRLFRNALSTTPLPYNPQQHQVSYQIPNNNSSAHVPTSARYYGEPPQYMIQGPQSGLSYGSTGNTNTLYRAQPTVLSNGSVASNQPFVSQPTTTQIQMGPPKSIGLPGLSLPPQPVHMMDWNQPVSIPNKRDCVLDASVKSIKFGLAWDAGCDVDGSVVLLDQQQRVLDIVSYRQLHSKIPGAVKHSGDDRTGHGGGDDETVKIKLRKLPNSVAHILAIVSVYGPKHKDLGNVRNLRVRLYHGSKKPTLHGKVLCHYHVSRSHLRGTSMACCVISRVGSWWSVRNTAVQSQHARTAPDFVSRLPRDLGALLAAVPQVPVEYRTVSVTVSRARNLQAADVCGTSDPFVTVEFRRQRDKSKPVKRTLSPQWTHPAGLVVHGVDAAEMKAVKIAVWDYDRFSSSDFLGHVKIPAAALYNLGFGKHELWLPLQSDPDRTLRRCTGEVQVKVTVGRS